MERLIGLRMRNVALRRAILRIISEADSAIREQDRRIALKQAAPVLDDNEETLERVYDNLRRRLDALARAGIIQWEDFKDLVWPPAHVRPAHAGADATQQTSDNGPSH